MGWIVLAVFALIWVGGWLSVASSVELEHSDRFWRKVASYAIVFFIWPYIAICMASQGDI
jgi:hypothetical protein